VNVLTELLTRAIEAFAHAAAAGDYERAERFLAVVFALDGKLADADA
jgi:hypothetical protein